MERAGRYISDDHRDELEDRAAEQVDRDWLLDQPRRDHAEARAEQQAHDLAVLAARAEEDARLGLNRPHRDWIYDR